MEPVVKMKPFILGLLLMHGVSGFDADIFFEKEGDSVTLLTNVKTNQGDRIRWYFNDTRIAQISGDLRKICTDVQCNEGTERFRDRLKMDPQTGSLTITNTRTTDSGLYHQETIISGSVSEKIFNVTITGRPGSEAVQMERKMMMKGASDALVNGETKTNGSDGGEEASVLSAIKTSTLGQASSNTKVTVGILLAVAAVAAAVGVIFFYSKRKQKINKCKIRGRTSVTCDAKFRDGLMPDEKKGSDEI